MGYFNYFIKCIIRNISYRLCKPKVLFTILLSIIILFSLKHFGFCALDDADYEMISDGFATITSNQGTAISYLSTIGVDVKDLETLLTSINDDVSIIMSNTGSISSNLITVIQKINTLNTNILNIYNELDANQKELLNTLNSNNNKIITELQAENQKILEELQQLRDALVGSESTPVSSNYLGLRNININGSIYNGCAVIEIPMEYGYTYKMDFTFKNTTSGDIFVSSFLSDTLVTNTNTSLGNSLTWHGWVKPGVTTTYSLTTREYQKKYLYLTWGSCFDSIEVTASIEGVVDAVDRTNQGIQEGNQLQQENNQLQQEQNDILTNDEVNTDELQFAQDNTNNPTSEGFNNLFTSIYNAFCTTSSSPLTVTLPFINQTFTISPNLVSNAMQKSGLGLIANLIHSFYYYSVCLFIYKDINKIIEHLKSGNLTADCGNVKTEVL